MIVTVMVMAVVVAYFDHNLRLHRIGRCEAEDENQSKQNLFHALSLRAVELLAELL